MSNAHRVSEMNKQKFLSRLSDVSQKQHYLTSMPLQSLLKYIENHHLPGFGMENQRQLLGFAMRYCLELFG